GMTQATASLGTVVIDTVGPRITNLVFDRGSGRMLVTFQDNLSGLDQHQLRDGANYHLVGRPLSRKIPVPHVILVTSISVSTATTPTDPQTSTVIFNNGRVLPGGRYLITVNSGSIDAHRNGIEDVAGNAMDGEFYGTFPTGNGRPGGNFVALITAFHN